MVEHNAAADLPLTSWGLLGLLADSPVSGYDLLKRINVGIGYFLWKPARSQIYTELGRLVARGYATAHPVEQERRPDKRVYQITPAGEQALRAWLAAPLAGGHSPLLLKIFFGRHIPRPVLIDQIRQAQAAEEATLTEYLRLEAAHPGKGPADFFPYLTLQAGLAHTRASIAWADTVIRQLEEATPAELGEHDDQGAVSGA